MMVSEEERNASFEAAGELANSVSGIFNDLLRNPTSNEAIAEFVRNKIRATVNDPEVAEALCPKDYPFATKRLCLDTNYYETFNRDNVELVDLRKHPISTITATGIETDNATYRFDAIVFATGFDAMTGAIVAVDIEGRDGLKLADKWSAGPKTYLGLTAVGFQLLHDHRPRQSSVLSNMVVSIEQHVDWVTDTIVKMRADGYDTIEPTEQAEEGWGSTSTTVRTSRSSPKPTRGTWGRTCPASLACSSPTSAVSTPTARSATTWSTTATWASNSRGRASSPAPTASSAASNPTSPCCSR
ncbi:MAG: hypothetical protein R2710_18035 [Acidimicrobiales bacterium]